MYVKLDTISNWKLCMLQVAFVAVKQYTPYINVFSITDTVNINISNVTHNNWLQCGGTYKANGGETAIIIGNLLTDGQLTCKSKITTTVQDVAYYHIDNLNLQDFTPNSVKNNEPSVSSQIYPNPTSDKIYFKNIKDIQKYFKKNKIYNINHQIYNELCIKEQKLPKYPDEFFRLTKNYTDISCFINNDIENMI